MFIILSYFLFIFGVLFMVMGLYFMNIEYCIFLDWEILSLNACYFSVSLIFDYLSLLFMGCVLFISSMVVFYSDSYMSSDLYKSRFLILVFLFIVSMMFMIMSPNLVSILLGWDGLGLVSYCLVIFFQNIKSFNAGMLTILSNRVGDVFILICISWMLNFGSWNFIYFLYFFDSYMWVLCYLIILASFTKSAQIPFSSWLPAAMAAPTPVSALVHSSTLVTAGVYLLIRFFPLIKFFDCTIFLVISLMTMFMSGLGANFEFDLKKVIALSTLSQLGLMMSILFMGFPELSFFHLLTHAFFKALLFLCAGLIIHVMSDCQDIRDMGFIMKVLPFTVSCFLVSSFSLVGAPFMSGFYSKDTVIELMFMHNYSFFYYLVFLVSVVLTMSYSMRLFIYLLFSGQGVYSCQAYFEDKKMILSMIFLTFFSVCFGVSFMWVFLKAPVFYVSGFFVKIMPISCIFIGILLGFVFFNFYIPSVFIGFYFMGSMWFMPFFSTFFSYSGLLFLSKNYSKTMDSGWGEFFFSHSHVLFIYFLSKMNNLLEFNNLSVFMIVFLMFMLFILI